MGTHGENFDFKSKYSGKSAEVIQSLLTPLSSDKAEPKSSFDRIASVFGSITILIGALGLLGWISWLRVFLGIRWDYISIAPITAAAFVILGVILILLVRKHYHAGRKVFVSTIIFFISIYGLLEFIGYFADVNLNFDSVFFPAAGKLGPFDLKGMSPITGILFFLSGVSLQLKVTSENRLRTLNLVGVYGLITLLAGLIASLGYVFGTPLLYGGAMIPIAATTAVGFLILGCGLVAIAGPKIFFIRPFVGSSASARMLQVLVPLIVIAILTEGYLIETFSNAFEMNHALLSVLLSLFFAIVTSILIVQIARVVFSKADAAEIERRQAQHDLEASEIRYRRLFESAKDGILLLNAETGEVIDINPFMVDMLGYSRDMFLGKELWEIGLFKDVVRSKEAFIDLKRKGYIRFEDLPLVTKGGQKINVEFVSNVYRVDGTTVIQCDIRDITERKKLQQELLQSQKIQSIGTLAGGIAHDFNNILAIILMYACQLEETQESKEKILESSRAITRAVDRGKELVRQILTFARKTEIVFEPMNIVELIYELLSMLKQAFPKVITFTENIAEDIPFIYGDRAQIHQALLNLFVNSRDAMPNGGSITIKVEKQIKDMVQNKFSDAGQESYICIDVTDTGEGMDTTTILRVFDPFFTTKEIGKGTGLGLAVVYGVMRSHHGFVGVESTPGHGTTFRLYFPDLMTDKHMIGIPTVIESYHVGGTETILLVEDEELLLESVCRLLRSKGYKVYTTQDGKEAVKIYTQHKQEIDLVITDLGLPGITGNDEFKKLKEMNPDVKVILASGFFEPDVKSELLKAGANGFIQKPYVPDDILRNIRAALDKT